MGLFSKLFNSKKVEVKQMEIKKPVENAVIKKASDKQKFSFSVAGSENYQDNFKKVMKRNSKYKTPSKKIIDEGMSDTVYEYKPFVLKQDIALVDDPSNELFVTCKGEVLGCIKKGSASRVKNLLKHDHELELKFYGGNYREY